jgi:hypothetical protein
VREKDEREEKLNVSRAVVQVLAIYLTRDCPSCESARRIADEIANMRPDIRIELMYLDNGDPLPPTIFGVPTFVWRGRVVSLGNPHVEDLLKLLNDPG